MQHIQQANSRSKCCSSSYKRLQLGIILLMGWVGGLFMGSNTMLNFQTRELVFATTGRKELERKALTPQDCAGVLNLSLGVNHHASYVFLNALLDTERRNGTDVPTHHESVSPSERPSNTSGLCKFPSIDPFDPSIEKYLKRYPPLNCSSMGPNIVRLDNDELKIEFAKVKEALVKTKSSGQLGFCQYKILRRKDASDQRAEVVSTSAKFNTSIKLNKKEEDVKVECYDTKNKVVSCSYFAIIRVDPEKERIHNDSYKVHIDKNSPAETLSVLMVGIDAFAKQHFARSMPKTRDFLIKELGALEMNKHSKLGYSTWPNVIPLLTGRTPEELTNDKKWRLEPRGWVDQINEAFVWSDARRLGYRTGLMFDHSHITAFHWLKKGFQRRPVDHYMRSIVVDSEGDKLMRHPDRNCYGDEPEISKLYDYWLQLLHHYNSTRSNQTPFFAYSFLVRLTHDDYNRAFAGDELYLKFLKDLKATNALNNTVIVWFSDHGVRFGALRHTFTGEVETNTPYLFFAFPPWFEKKYPDLMRVFKTNQNRLTSHYDTYATLQDLINFKGVVGPKGKLGERSISLFREIPIARTCEDSQIPAEYCLCSGLSPAELSPGQDKYLGDVIVDTVMSLLEKKSAICSKLTLHSVQQIVEEKESRGKSKSATRTFRVGIMTVPGNAQFEARLSFDTATQKAMVIGEVARISMYRGQSDCVNTPELRRYCYCKNLLQKKKR